MTSYAPIAYIYECPNCEGLCQSRWYDHRSRVPVFLNADGLTDMSRAYWSDASLFDIWQCPRCNHITPSEGFRRVLSFLTEEPPESLPGADVVEKRLRSAWAKALPELRHQPNSDALTSGADDGVVPLHRLHAYYSHLNGQRSSFTVPGLIPSGWYLDNMKELLICIENELLPKRDWYPWLRVELYRHLGYFEEAARALSEIPDSTAYPDIYRLQADLIAREDKATHMIDGFGTNAENGEIKSVPFPAPRLRH